MNQLDKVFDNVHIRIRIDKDGTPWFCGQDVCRVLGISKPLDMFRNLDDDERVSMAVDTPGGNQKMTYVNESGLYEMIFRSRHQDT